MSVTEDPDLSTAVTEASSDATAYYDDLVSKTYGEGESTGSATTAQDYAQLSLTVIGVFANAVTLLVLNKSKKISFSKLILLLLKHQTFCDLMVCLLAIPMIVQPFMWKTHVLWLDVFLCHLWHSQVLFWSALLLSIWNLVMIAIERYIAICFPLRHVTMAKRHLYYMFVFVYISNFISCIPMPLDMSYNHTLDICTNVHLFKGEIYSRFLKFYGSYWFASAYVIPLTLFVVLYGQILKVLHKRRHESDFQNPSVLDQANSHFTRTVIMVTVVFFIAISYDPWYYFLASVGVVVYRYGTALQKVGLFMNVFNSCANPFIYVSSMPQFRHAIKEVFLGNDRADNQNSNSSQQPTTGSSKF